MITLRSIESGRVKSRRSEYGLFSLFILLIITFPLKMFGEEVKNNNDKQKKSDLIILPIIYYMPETSLAYGLGGIYVLKGSEHEQKSRPSSVLMSVVRTLKKQFIVEIYPDFYVKKGKYHLVPNFNYRTYSERFYGIGNNTKKDIEEEYSFQSFKLDFTLQRKVSEKFYAGIQYEFEYNKITDMEPGGILETEDIVGKELGASSGFGLVVNWDSRDNIFYPKRGKYCLVSAKFFNPSFGGNYSFNRFNFDFRQYISFFPTHTLALQGYIDIKTGEPPFQKLSLLGGQYLMRGYYKGRFRDKNMIALQMEYRIHLFWKLGIVGFLGFGDVANTLNKFKLGSFKYTGGVGIRFQINREGNHLRLDFGFGRETFGVYFAVNEAF